MDFDVRISLSDTTHEASLARDYWEPNANGGHAYKVSNIAKRYGLLSYEATPAVKRLEEIVQLPER